MLVQAGSDLTAGLVCILIKANRVELCSVHRRVTTTVFHFVQYGLVFGNIKQPWCLSRSKKQVVVSVSVYHYLF
jgi:hypothetical protein